MSFAIFVLVEKDRKTKFGILSRCNYETRQIEILRNFKVDCWRTWQFHVFNKFILLMVLRSAETLGMVTTFACSKLKEARRNGKSMYDC